MSSRKFAATVITTIVTIPRPQVQRIPRGKDMYDVFAHPPSTYRTRVRRSRRRRRRFRIAPRRTVVWVFVQIEPRNRPRRNPAGERHKAPCRGDPVP
jgi:hypothetical protein